MNADKEEIALYYEAKNDKVRKRLGIKGGFYWRTAKNYRLQYHVVLLQWTMPDLTKRILKNPSASIYPL
ncbi:putative phage exodeoxyribonuclease VIII [Escherichia coli DEC11E]|uniref:hypothetical protein n=1 Tax=Escherichia coli TaxID=562 RepID=UPI0002510F89|nr:hypothetical protein [Escherichia coli]EHX13945.1 putative phage exodeoxyribonuclease VIII [Escherichia coli DEC11E]